MHRYKNAEDINCVHKRHRKLRPMSKHILDHRRTVKPINFVDFSIFLIKPLVLFLNKSGRFFEVRFCFISVPKLTPNRFMFRLQNTPIYDDWEIFRTATNCLFIDMKFGFWLCDKMAFKLFVVMWLISTFTYNMCKTPNYALLYFPERRKSQRIERGTLIVRE